MEEKFALNSALRLQKVFVIGATGLFALYLLVRQLKSKRKSTPPPEEISEPIKNAEETSETDFIEQTLYEDYLTEQATIYRQRLDSLSMKTGSCIRTTIKNNAFQMKMRKEKERVDSKGKSSDQMDQFYFAVLHALKDE